MSQNSVTTQGPVSVTELGGPSHVHSSKAEDNPWDSKVILTLDGGGVRGYGSLLMLQVLMHAIKKLELTAEEPHSSSFCPYEPSMHVSTHATNGAPEDPGQRARTDTRTSAVATPSRSPSPADSQLKPSLTDVYLPCHYFDYIGGTSTGGLSAIMLGRLRMSVDQCVYQYPTMATRIFSKPRWQVKGWPRNKYDAKNLENTITNIVQARGGKERPPYTAFRSPDDLCRTFVVANKLVNEIKDEPRIFRTYQNFGFEDSRLDRWDPTTPGPADDELIWRIGRATAAAPTFFKPIQIGEDYYSDGGLGYNNPAELAYEEVLYAEGYFQTLANSLAIQPTISTRIPIPIPIKIFLSIGTGGDDRNQRTEESRREPPTDLNDNAPRRKRAKASVIKHFRNLTARLQGQATQVKRSDARVRLASRRDDWQYVRWVGGKDLERHKMDKWKSARAGSHGTKVDIEKWIEEYMDNPVRRLEVESIAKTLVDIRRRRIQHQEGDRWQRFAHCSHLSECPRCHTTDYKVTGTKAKLAEHVEKCFKDDPPAPDIRTWTRIAPKVIGGPL